MTTTYEGWSNWETWNVNLWFDNDYKLYQRKLSFLEARAYQVTAEEVRSFIKLQLPSGTSDLQSEARRQRRKNVWANVNWQELAEDWKNSKD